MQHNTAINQSIIEQTIKNEPTKTNQLAQTGQHLSPTRYPPPSPPGLAPTPPPPPLVTYSFHRTNNDRSPLRGQTCPDWRHEADEGEVAAAAVAAVTTSSPRSGVGEGGGGGGDTEGATGGATVADTTGTRPTKMGH